MRQNQLNNVSYLKDKRRSLRNNLTPAEAALWTVLKNSQFKDRKFRRQHSIGNYIADFCCPSEKLIIELDGEVHNDPGRMEYDAERDSFLRQAGYKVLRFENKLVFQHLDGLLEVIESNFKT